MFRLDDKHTVVTGAASGIGRAVALVFARQGAHVHLLDRNEEGLSAVMAEIIALGGTAEMHNADVTSQAEVQKLFANIGRVDVLVNCAGISNIGKAHTTPEADFEKVFQVNVKGIYNCLHAALPLMMEANGGVIVNITSIANSVGIPDRFAYSMSKGAVLGMTLSVAKDYLQNNIRCNCVSPARVHTPFVDDFIAKTYPGQEKEMFEKLSKTQPIGRMGRPEEIANLVLYLSSDEASFITGCDYPIDGGFIKLNN